MSRWGISPVSHEEEKGLRLVIRAKRRLTGDWSQRVWRDDGLSLAYRSSTGHIDHGLSVCRMLASKSCHPNDCGPLAESRSVPAAVQRPANCPSWRGVPAADLAKKNIMECLEQLSRFPRRTLREGVRRFSEEGSSGATDPVVATRLCTPSAQGCFSFDEPPGFLSVE